MKIKTLSNPALLFLLVALTTNMFSLFSAPIGSLCRQFSPFTCWSVLVFSVLFTIILIYLVTEVIQAIYSSGRPIFAWILAILFVMLNLSEYAHYLNSVFGLKLSELFPHYDPDYFVRWYSERWPRVFPLSANWNQIVLGGNRQGDKSVANQLPDQPGDRGNIQGSALDTGGVVPPIGNIPQANVNANRDDNKNTVLNLNSNNLSIDFPQLNSSVTTTQPPISTTKSPVQLTATPSSYVSTKTAIPSSYVSTKTATPYDSSSITATPSSYVSSTTATPYDSSSITAPP